MMKYAHTPVAELLGKIIIDKTAEKNGLIEHAESGWDLEKADYLDNILNILKGFYMELIEEETYLLARWKKHENKDIQYIISELLDKKRFST